MTMTAAGLLHRMRTEPFTPIIPVKGRPAVYVRKNHLSLSPQRLAALHDLKRRNVLEMLSLISLDGDCMVWGGPIEDSSGIGLPRRLCPVVDKNNRIINMRRSVSIVLAEHFFPGLPKSRHVRSCRRRECVNPQHWCKNLSFIRSPLTRDQVESVIIYRAVDGFSFDKIAELVGTNDTTVKGIVKGTELGKWTAQLREKYKEELAAAGAWNRTYSDEQCREIVQSCYRDGKDMHLIADEHDMQYRYILKICTGRARRRATKDLLIEYGVIQ